VPNVTPAIVGALIALYERAVGLYASLVNINAYHQPGVEAGKKAAAGILDLQARMIATVQQAPNSLGLADLAAKIGAEKDIETIYQILRHLNANNRHIKIVNPDAKPSEWLITLQNA
ncbi:MAG: glucose-6-phosphate isomerase, partial [Cyanobacteria bacterium P01_H01_bin.152]